MPAEARWSAAPSAGEPGPYPALHRRRAAARRVTSSPEERRRLHMPAARMSRTRRAGTGRGFGPADAGSTIPIAAGIGGTATTGIRAGMPALYAGATTIAGKLNHERD